MDCPNCEIEMNVETSITDDINHNGHSQRVVEFYKCSECDYESDDTFSDDTIYEQTVI